MHLIKYITQFLFICLPILCMGCNNSITENEAVSLSNSLVENVESYNFTVYNNHIPCLVTDLDTGECYPEAIIGKVNSDNYIFIYYSHVPPIHGLGIIHIVDLSSGSIIVSQYY